MLSREKQATPRFLRAAGLQERIFYQWNDGKVCFCDCCAVLVESWNDEDHVVDEHPREEKEPNEVGPYVDRLIV